MKSNKMLWIMIAVLFVFNGALFWIQHTKDVEAQMVCVPDAGGLNMSDQVEVSGNGGFAFDLVCPPDYVMTEFYFKDNSDDHSKTTALCTRVR